MTKKHMYIIGIIVIFATGFIYNSIPKDEYEAISITTSMHCDACKKTIETALGAVDGIIKSEAVISESAVKVIYEPNLTNTDEIRRVISNAGYDADNIKANKQAYNNLPDCCKHT